MDITLCCVAVLIAAVITGVLGKFMIPFLHKLKFGQTIREEGPTWHAAKQGTPTMGGLMFLIGGYAAAIICIAFVWMHGGAENQLMVVKVVGGLLMALGFCFVGFMDDFISIRKKRNLGLTEIQKLVLQFAIAGAYLFSVAL
jgi:phospho-N-acetylmuramoyl-pentapeptide-transferase